MNPGCRCAHPGYAGFAFRRSMEARGHEGAAAMADKITARVQKDKKLFIHNDLSQGATFFNDIIQEKLKKDDRNGIAFDGMACALMIAFAFEANLNFMGEHLYKNGKVTSWDEKSKFWKKLDKVFGAIGIPVEKEKRPLSSMIRMKNLRDTLAHGKPVEIKGDDEQTGTEEELRSGASLAADWQQEVKPDVVAECLSDLDDLWKQMIQKSGINIMDTMTQGATTITVIQRAAVK
jgi:hypothetical protein